MMQKTIANQFVQVLYQLNPEIVVVTNMHGRYSQQPFAGFDGLKELFDSYCQSFSDQTDFKTTIDFFKPNIKQTVINAQGH